MPTIEELRTRIKAACEAAKAYGLDIVADDWGVTWTDGAPKADRCCCPLGAVAVCEKVPDIKNDYDDWIAETYMSPELPIARWLGVSDNWIDGFVSGVDGIAVVSGDNKEAHALGAEFRARYIETP